MKKVNGDTKVITEVIIDTAIQRVKTGKNRDRDLKGAGHSLNFQRMIR